jgi:four helix bundle protein
MDSKEMLLRTRKFAYDCIDLCDKLDGTYLKRHVKGQLIRCSTSVNSNYRATRLAQSKRSFIAKLSIVIEEADESAMWLELIIDKCLLATLDDSKRLMNEGKELTSIFIATRKSLNST